MHNLSPLGVGPGNVGVLFADCVKHGLFCLVFFLCEKVEIAGVNGRGRVKRFVAERRAAL